MTSLRMPEADAKLVKSALAGDATALALVGERMGCVLRILACLGRRLGYRMSDADLRDIAQDTVARAWQKADTYRGHATLETWLWRFCHLELLNHRRSRARGPRLFSDIDDDARAEPEAPPMTDDPDDDSMGVWLKHLAPRAAEVVRLKHVDQLSFPEIATVLELAPSTVKTCYYRGVEKLRQMAAREHEGGDA